MFQESFLAPLFEQLKMLILRSPEVALLPLVGGSMQAVMTPWWTPILGSAPVLAEASETSVIKEITIVVAISHVLLGDFAMPTPFHTLRSVTLHQVAFEAARDTSGTEGRPASKVRATGPSIGPTPTASDGAAAAKPIRQGRTLHA
jgi:hypothetical protein